MYTNRLSTGGPARAPISISLSAFEYFVFHLANYVHNTANRLSPFFDQENPANSLYITLIELYLSFFVPLDSSSKKDTNSSETSSIWQSLSSTTSMFLHLNDSRKNASHFGGHSSTNMPKTSLLNMKALLNQSNDIYSPNRVMNSSNKSMDPLGSDISKAETFLNIISEMWINVKVPAHLVKKMPAQTHFQTLAVNNLDHIRCVRILVKHLHYFSNSLRQRTSVPGGAGVFENRELDELKRNIWTNKYVFQKRLYSFIRVAFEKWPLDASFRLPLEIWLSYIQAWRYVEFNPARSSVIDEGMDPPNSRNENIAFDGSWRRFIDDNLLFYTVIFRQLIPRFMRLDLSSSINSFLLFRVVKVFNQDNLLSIIKESEDSFESSFSPVRNISSRLISPFRNSIGASAHHGLIYRHPLLECEDNDFTYARLFSAKVEEEIRQLMKKVITTLKEIAQFVKNHAARNEDGTFTLKTLIKKSISPADDYLGVDERTIITEKMKTENYLGVILDRLAVSFNIDPVELKLDQEGPSEPTTPNSKSSMEFSSSEEPLSPDLHMRKRTVKPEPLEGLFRGNIEYLGNPDLQPVRSFEIAILVKIFIMLSTLINNAYSHQIEKIYHRRGLFAQICREFLEPPTKYQCLEKHGNLVPPRRKIIELGPRICLRHLARRSFYGYIGLFYMIFYFLFGFGKFTSAFFIVLIFSIHIVIRGIRNWICS